MPWAGVCVASSSAESKEVRISQVWCVVWCLCFSLLLDWQ